MERPSGDHFGSLSLSPAVSRRAATGFTSRASPNAVGKSHNSVRPSLLSMSYAVTAAHAVAPSGESVGAPTRLTAHNASTLNGCLRRGELRVAFAAGTAIFL